MFDFKEKDFTIHKFRRLCEAVASNYQTITMAEYFKGQKPENFVLMRHDVDRMPGHALATARIEHELGIRSTYYFRAMKNTFKPNIMKQIEDMGHEVGYHYEDLSVANGDSEKAIEMFKSNLADFRRICDVKTICMHGRPLSKYDNRDLWKTYAFEDYGIIGEAYLSAGEELNYFSDTGRNWGDKNSLRDHMSSTETTVSAKTTHDLIDMVLSRNLSNYYILTHPERWSLNLMDWSMYFAMDNVFNVGKKTLQVMRG
ncbi:MAG: hypothetical protein ACOCUV_00360 [bacterium]